MHSGFWWETLKERVHLKKPDVNVRVTLKLTVYVKLEGLDCILFVSECEKLVGPCEHRNETLGSIKSGKISD
jgi:hypothetical protein